MKNWDRIVDDIEVLLIDSDELKLFINSDEDDLIGLHHSMGRYIRNEYKLWTDEGKEEFGVHFMHPDELSQGIINYIQTKLKKKHNPTQTEKVLEIIEDNNKKLENMDDAELSHSSFDEYGYIK